MVKITIELLRKKAEHHEHQLAPLREISLHQESIEKIEVIQDCCPKLQILLLQSNIIPKIENLSKLKELEYLNLAINNIEVVENLERCESLEKLDLTLNFIGKITSLKTLQNNYNLRYLYLNGNPCTDFEGYRKYVIALLPQLEELDSEEIKRSDRIRALQSFIVIEENVKRQEEVYKITRSAQKERLEKKIQDKWKNGDDNLSEENIQRFWSEKSEHSPEIRIEMERLNQIKRNAKNISEEKKSKKPRPLFASDGRPYNINEAKIPFLFKDENINQFDLEVQLYRHLDTSLIDIDLQPSYVRLIVKNKIFQIALPEEINISESTAKGSQTTGYLLITMKKCKIINISEANNESPISASKNKAKENKKEISAKAIDLTKIAYKNSSMSSKREFLEIGPSENILDLTKMISRNSYTSSKPHLGAHTFEDDTNVPPLI